MFVGKKVRKEMAGEGLWWQSVSSPVLSWELSQKSREDKNHHMALECFDAAKRKFRPKEMFLEMNSEVYWEQVEADERNFHFFSDCHLNLGRKVVGE